MTPIQAHTTIGSSLHRPDSATFHSTEEHAPFAHEVFIDENILEERQPSRVLAFIERHEVMVQFLPFLVALALIALSLVSETVASMMAQL